VQDDFAEEIYLADYFMTLAERNQEINSPGTSYAPLGTLHEDMNVVSTKMNKLDSTWELVTQVTRGIKLKAGFIYNVLSMLLVGMNKISRGIERDWDQVIAKKDRSPNEDDFIDLYVDTVRSQLKVLQDYASQIQVHIIRFMNTLEQFLAFKAGEKGVSYIQDHFTGDFDTITRGSGKPQHMSRGDYYQKAINRKIQYR
jgi:hypothetical protein